MSLPWLPRPRGINSPRDLPNLGGWYDAKDPGSMLNNAGTVPASGDGIKLWSDKSGNSAVNVFASGGEASNTATSPTKSITGSQVFTVSLSGMDFTPASDTTLFSKLSGNNGCELLILTTGVVRLRIGDGASVTNVDSTASIPTADYAAATIVATWTNTVGAAFTVNGAALGTAVAAVKTLTDAATTATIGTNFAGSLLRVQVGAVYDFNPALGTKLAASVVSGGDTWTINTSGDTGARISGARDLYQGTVSKQPVYLPWVGSNYGYVNGVALNYFTTPDSVPLRVTGDLDLRAFVALSSWASGSENPLVSKWSTAAQLCYNFSVNSAGNLLLRVSLDGSATVSVVSSVTVGFGAFVSSWVRVTRASATGTVFFYTSTDGVNWTQLGTSVATTSGAIFAGTSIVLCGALNNAVTMNGRIYRAQIYNGIAGTLAFDFNPAAYTSGTTLLDRSVNAATITINAGATIVTRTCVYGDGADDFVKAAPYSQSQPVTGYLTGQQVSWTSGDVFMDGNAVTTGQLLQATGTPQVNISAGTSVAGNTNWVLQTGAVVTPLFNGASSALRVNRGTATTGNANTGTMNGLTLFASGTPANYANATVSELALYAAAHGADTQGRAIPFFGRANKIAV